MRGEGNEETMVGSASFQTEAEGTPQEFMKTAASLNSHTATCPWHKAESQRFGQLWILAVCKLNSTGSCRDCHSASPTITSGSREERLPTL